MANETEQMSLIDQEALARDLVYPPEDAHLLGSPHNMRLLHEFHEAVQDATNAVKVATQALYEMDWELLPDLDVEEIIDAHKAIHGAAGHLVIVVTRIKHNGD